MEEKELNSRLDALSGRINRLELIFEANRASNNKIVHALAVDTSVATRMALEATEKAQDAFK